jgi:hypothetical protein
MCLPLTEMDRLKVMPLRGESKFNVEYISFEICHYSHMFPRTIATDKNVKDCLQSPLRENTWGLGVGNLLPNVSLDHFVEKLINGCTHQF